MVQIPTFFKAIDRTIRHIDVHNVTLINECPFFVKLTFNLIIYLFRILNVLNLRDNLM